MNISNIIFLYITKAYLFIAKILKSLFWRIVERLLRFERITLVFFLAIGLLLVTQMIGLMALVNSPILDANDGQRLLKHKNDIRQIHLIDVHAHFFDALPLFVNRELEQTWWQAQKILAVMLSMQNNITIKSTRNDNEKIVSVKIKKLSFAK